MCQICRNPSHEPAVSRRHFLRGLGAASAVGLFGSRLAHANAPKPGNVLTPDQALDRLRAGNQRYVEGKHEPDSHRIDRESLARGQNPFACVLACADSRVAPEFCFDEGPGDLFVARVAGNYLTLDILASLEYAIAVLKTPLIMVMGHDHCGAVKAAIEAYQQDTSFPGHIQNISSAISAAVENVDERRKTSGIKQDFATEVAIENARLNARLTAESTPIIRRQVREGKVKVVAGVYTIETGRVSLINT